MYFTVEFSSCPGFFPESCKSCVCVCLYGHVCVCDCCVCFGPNEVVNASAVLPIPPPRWYLPLHLCPVLCPEYTRKSNKTLTSLAVWVFGFRFSALGCVLARRLSHPFEVKRGACPRPLHKPLASAKWQPVTVIFPCSFLCSFKFYCLAFYGQRLQFIYEFESRLVLHLLLVQHLFLCPLSLIGS